MLASLFFALALPLAAPETVHVEVGSPAVDGRVYRPHAARVTVRVGSPDGPQRAVWTNELTLGDSLGRRVMRWVTRGTQTTPTGESVTWELHQTYDAITLQPYSIVRRSSNGGRSAFTVEGRRVRGLVRAPGETEDRVIEYELDRLGFVASASDLVPLAVGMREGLVISAPIWGPQMRTAEQRTFTVRGEVDINVEGTMVKAWKVDEHRVADRALLATWYLTAASPYMVYGEVPLPNGQMQYMSEVAVPHGAP
jgi:hypothetical protein